MTILYPQQALHDLKDSTIFLDTNVFSIGARCQPLIDMLVTLKADHGCSLTTIPSVLFEFTNGSSDLQIFNQRRELMSAIVDSVNPARYINNIDDFSVVMAKINGQNRSYTDFLLAAALYSYRHAKVYLLTTDLRALPKFFDRVSIIMAEEKSGDVKNFGIYSFNEESYLKAARSIIRA
ncbi:MAG TPA: hypothetical protein VK502_00260 [Candidatus Saccharimonadales bacterium]|nr:hypothetical protein [Candidatus Saccharimonadales bacterium]